MSLSVSELRVKSKSELHSLLKESISQITRAKIMHNPMSSGVATPKLACRVLRKDVARIITVMNENIKKEKGGVDAL